MKMHTTIKTPEQIRTVLMGKIHILAKQLGFEEGTYRTVLLTQTGRTSCRDMTTPELSALADTFERMAQGKPTPQLTKTAKPSKPAMLGQLRPTERQWLTLQSMSLRAGWSGLDDFRLLSFVLHTVKVPALDDLNRSTMSKVITGMSRMLLREVHADDKKSGRKAAA